MSKPLVIRADNIKKSTGLQMDGHSRGALTVTNVYSSLLNDDKKGAYPNLRTNMVGPAASFKNADAKLAQLQGREEILVTDPLNNGGNVYRPTTEKEKMDMSIHYQNHKSDFVGTVIGLNPATGGNNFEDTSTIGEWKNMFGGPATVHSCYGSGKPDCEDKKYWDDGIPNNGKDLPVWKPIYEPKPKK